jgi:hypothetical protein
VSFARHGERFVGKTARILALCGRTRMHGVGCLNVAAERADRLRNVGCWRVTATIGRRMGMPYQVQGIAREPLHLPETARRNLNATAFQESASGADIDPIFERFFA